MRSLLLISLLILSACAAETERNKLCKFLRTCGEVGNGLDIE
jgi:hypothetical protein